MPDYTLVVKAPMDLSTLLTNIDEQKYVTVDEFVCDADLIWKNALEYNPDSDPMGETPPPRRPPRDQKECFYSQNCIHFKVFVCVCVRPSHPSPGVRPEGRAALHHQSRAERRLPESLRGDPSLSDAER